MDTIILAASLISFFALMGGWLVLPSSTETAHLPHGAAVQA